MREFLIEAFGSVEMGCQNFVKFNHKNYSRPAEVDLLISDASKAKRILGLEPKTQFRELVQVMVDADLERVQQSPKIKVKVA